eukprot:GFUD01105481.1.p1 GENE.GFUD01105481.1~~GFUD01105481.1.p1  ORF type:complete len:141 (+),score=1.17 GFUD01105481.1:38-460(+)
MNLVIKFPLLLMFGLSNPYNPHPLYPQHFPATQVRDSPQKSPDDWWYSMGDDWEVSKKLKTISPHYASFNRMQQQMAMYAPALHVGRINRDETKPAPAVIYKHPQYANMPRSWKTGIRGQVGMWAMTGKLMPLILLRHMT